MIVQKEGLRVFNKLNKSMLLMMSWEACYSKWNDMKWSVWKNKNDLYVAGFIDGRFTLSKRESHKMNFWRSSTDFEEAKEVYSDDWGPSVGPKTVGFFKFSCCTLVHCYWTVMESFTESSCPLTEVIESLLTRSTSGECEIVGKGYRDDFRCLLVVKNF